MSTLDFPRFYGNSSTFNYYVNSDVNVRTEKNNDIYSYKILIYKNSKISDYDNNIVICMHNVGE